MPVALLQHDVFTDEYVELETWDAHDPIIKSKILPSVKYDNSYINNINNPLARTRTRTLYLRTRQRNLLEEDVEHSLSLPFWSSSLDQTSGVPGLFVQQSSTTTSSSSSRALHQHHDDNIYRDDAIIDDESSNNHNDEAIRLASGSSSSSEASNTNNNNNNIQSMHQYYNYYYVRKCTCFDGEYVENFGSTYCPFTTNTCREIVDTHVPEPYPRDVMCYTDPLDIGNYQLLWVCIFAVWGTFVAFVIGTHNGRSCLSYLPAKFFKGWNPTVATILLTYNPTFARQLIRRNVRIQQEQLERQILRTLQEQERNRRRADAGGVGEGAGAVTTDAGGAMVSTNDNIELGTINGQQQQQRSKPPTSLILKTRIYKNDTAATTKLRMKKELTQHSQTDGDETSNTTGNLDDSKDCSSSNNNDTNDDNEDVMNDHHDDYDDDDYDNTCTICFAPLVDGERVGALPCSHVYHVDCLKLWLQRQNVCPLCKVPEIAEPKYDDDVNENENENENDENANTEDDGNNANIDGGGNNANDADNNAQ